MSKKFVSPSLQDVPQKDWAVFGERVRSAGGRAIVLVHPFYKRLLSLRPDKKYYGAINGLLKKSKVPVVILEEAHKIGWLKKRLRELGTKNHLILPTDYDSPRLLVGPDPKTKHIVLDEESAELAKRLHEAGAKSIQVGGLYTTEKYSSKVEEYERKWLPKENQPSKKTIAAGCAGATYEELINSGKFEKVRLMQNACYRDRPLYPLAGEPRQAPLTAHRKKLSRSKLFYKRLLNFKRRM